jgi:hypothetical protein
VGSVKRDAKKTLESKRWSPNCNAWVNSVSSYTEFALELWFSLKNCWCFHHLASVSPTASSRNTTSEGSKLELQCGHAIHAQLGIYCVPSDKEEFIAFTVCGFTTWCCCLLNLHQTDILSACDFEHISIIHVYAFIYNCIHCPLFHCIHFYFFCENDKLSQNRNFETMRNRWNKQHQLKYFLLTKHPQGYNELIISQIAILVITIFLADFSFPT